MQVGQLRNDDREFIFNDKEFRFLSELVNKNTGIVLAEHKKDMVYSRLARRLRFLELKTFAEYCELLQGRGGAEEICHMVNAITTNLTSFFREGHHFEHLRDNVLMPFSDSAVKTQKLRIWSAACSSGMEAYSIAMTLRSAIKNFESWDIRILATDIDTNILNTAKKGEYPLEQMKNIPSCYHDCVEVKNDGKTIKMPDYIKSLIVFNQLNLLGGWPMKGLFDAVFCRNVVIYFNKETQRILFNRIADFIKPEGWLYIGHSENLHNISDRFELIGRTIYKKVK